MALTTYTELVAAVADWLARSDLTDAIPDFVKLAEERLSRDLRVLDMETSTTLSTVAGTRTVALPSTWRETRGLSISGSPYVEPELVSPEFYWSASYSSESGKPRVYYVEGGSLVFGPIPDAVYSVFLRYTRSLPDLATNSTNWLLTKHPSAYLYATLLEAEPYLQNDERVGLWETKLKIALESIELEDQRARYRGTVLRPRVM